jgi:hypothetical protein
LLTTAYLCSDLVHLIKGLIANVTPDAVVEAKEHLYGLRGSSKKHGYLSAAYNARLAEFGAFYKTKSNKKNPQYAFNWYLGILMHCECVTYTSLMFH